jgi:hypothetical protein
MRWSLLVAIVLVLIGLVWIGQGIGLVGGSFMTGQGSWAVIGSVILVVGLAILWRGRGTSRGSRPT